MRCMLGVSMVDMPTARSDGAYVTAKPVVCLDAAGNVVSPLASGGTVVATGDLANNVADNGAKSIKLGGVYNNVGTALTSGSRGDVQVDQYGCLFSRLTVGSGNMGGNYSINGSMGDANSNTFIGYVFANRGYNFNGTTWDRARGDASGSYVAGAAFWTESTTAQTGNATVNGALRSNGGTAAGVGSRYNAFVAEAYADQAGTLYVDKTTDGGTTWRQVSSAAVAAGATAQIKVPISAASYRARYVNGASAQGAFLLTSSFVTA